MLTGERRVIRADVMLDAGNSLSPAIDAGQASIQSAAMPVVAIAWHHDLCPVHSFSDPAGYLNCEWQLHIWHKHLDFLSDSAGYMD